MTTVHAGLALAESLDSPFDYARAVFGNEHVIDTSARNWGAVRMQRCLRSLEAVRGRVLEVGCGAGRVIRTIRHYRSDLRAFGCDLSQLAIGKAREHADGVQYAVSNAEGLPYPSAVFDGVVIMDLLEHVPDVSMVLDEVRRVCKPGAIMHLHVPCEGAPLSLYRPLIAMGCDLTRRAVGHLHHFRRGEVIRHLDEAGFDIVRTRNSMYWFAQLHDMIGWLNRLSAAPPESASRCAGKAGAAGLGRTLPTPAGLPKPPVTNPWRIRLKHLFSKPAWWCIHAALPRLQYVELRTLAWQPLGAIGLCVTARKR